MTLSRLSIFTLTFATTLTLSAREFAPGANIPILRQTAVGLYATADMNRDGLADIIGVAANGATIGIRISAAGGVESSLELPFNANGTPREMFAQDMNGDGDPDIVTLVTNANAPSASLCILLGNRQLRFSPVACTLIPATLLNPLGALRIKPIRVPQPSFPTAPTPPPISAILIVDGTSGLLTAATLVDTSVSFGPRVGVGHPILAFDGADTNGDGATELLYSSDPQGLFEASLLNILRGSVTTVRFETSSWGEVAVADFNADSRIDVAVLDRLTGRLRIFAGTNTATEYREQPPVTIPDGAAQAFRQLFVADADRDGRPDLLARTVNGLVLYRNTGSGFTFDLTRNFAPIISANSVAFFSLAEVNGDNFADLLYIADNNTATNPFPSPAASLILHNGRPSFTETVLDLPAPTANAGTPVRLAARVLRASQTGGFGSIGGSVQFFQRDTLLETVALRPAGPGDDERLFGTATVDRVFPPGVTELRAVYSGSTGFLTSPSRTVSLTVRGSASEIRVTQSPRTIGRGELLRITVEATAPGITNITGTVAALRGTARLATATLENGRATIAIPTGDLPLGPQRVRLVLESTVLPAAETEAAVFVSGLLNAVNAASYGAVIAPDSIAVLQAPGLSVPSTVAGGLPWPTELSGVGVSIRDSRGSTLAGRVYFAGPNQINFLVPGGLEPGEGEVRLVFAGAMDFIAAPIRIANTQPGIFTANGDGRGVPAAIAVRLLRDGTVEPVAVFSCSSLSGCLPAAIEVTAEEPVFLSLYGTGWRGASAVTVTLGGETIRPDFSGAHPEIPGLDQLNLRLPATVRGSASLTVNAGGVNSNPVQLLFR